MKRELIYAAVIGGVVGAVLVAAAGSFAPLGAQSQSDGNFGAITCTSLQVKRADGARGVLINADEDGGGIYIYGYGEDIIPVVGIGIDKYGGFVGVYGRGNNHSRAVMSVNEYGNGAVSTWDKNRYRLATLK